MSRGIFCVAAATLTMLSTAVSAMPASIGASLQQPNASLVTEVQFDPGYPATPLDLPAAVIGGTLGLVTGAFSPGYYGGPYGPYSGAPYGYAERMTACAANFQSFDPVSGTYTTYEGFQVLCPFLR